MLKSNEYFEGKVKSIALSTNEGPATVGVMEKGEYEFGTSSKEIMTVVYGILKIKLENSNDFVTYKNGETFEVEKNSKFQVIAEVDTAYTCFYK